MTKLWAWIHSKRATIEVIGIFLVLVAAGWQIFLEDHLREEKTLGMVARLENKVDDIWRQMSKLVDASGEMTGVAVEPYSKVFTRTEWGGGGADPSSILRPAF